MRRFPFLTTAFHGTMSYRSPSNYLVTLRQRELAQGYQKALSDIGNPARWPLTYTVSIQPATAEAAGSVDVLLTPRGQSVIDHVVAAVDEASATISRVEWYYKDGGHALMFQRFAMIDGCPMAVHQVFDIVTRGANVAVEADLTNYSITRLAPQVRVPAARAHPRAR